MQRKFSVKHSIIAFIPALLILGSCTNSDIKTAKEFGETSKTLRKLNTDVSGDIYNSCTRSSTWLARGTSATRASMRNGLKTCDTLFRPNSIRTAIAGQLLVEYVSAIGALATEDRETVKTRFEEIGTALQGLTVQTGESSFQIQQSTIDTGVKIATFLTNIILNDFRRKNLKAAIVCTDEDIQVYSKNLSSFISKLYVQALLDDEIDSVTRYFGGYRSPLTDSTNLLLDSGSPDIFISLQETQLKRDENLRSEVSKIIEKKNIGGRYATLIQATATAHNDLKKIFNDGNDELSPELKAKCSEYFSSENTSASSKEVFKNSLLDQEISLYELEQIRKVAKAYNKKVKPLLINSDQN